MTDIKSDDKIKKPQDVIELGVHSGLSPSQALEMAKRKNYETVIIIGIQENGYWDWHNSGMTYAECIYYLEHMRIEVMTQAKERLDE